MEKLYKIYDENKVIGYGYKGKFYESILKLSASLSDEENKQQVEMYNVSKEKWLEKETIYNDQNKKSKKNKVLKAVASVTAVGALGAAVAGTLSSCSKESTKNGKQELVEQTGTLEDLLKQLENENQQNAFRKMCDAQDAFNNTAAPSIVEKYDNNAQLYLKSNEVVALYAFANADTWSNEEMGKILGKKLLDSEQLLTDYVQAARVMNTYYRYAEQPSGLSVLFEDEENKRVFEEFENLVIEYNKTQDEKVKQQISEKLTEIYLSGQIDDIKTLQKEAASFIATLIVPSLYERQIIDQKLYDSVIEINETITCDELKNELKESEKYATEENDELLTKIVNKMDETYITSDNRNINIEERENDKLDDIGGNSLGGGYISSGNVSSDRETISRDEAVNEFGEAAVEDAEQNANQQFEQEYKDKNESQKAYAQGLSDGYAITYERTFDAYVNSNTTLTAASFSSSISAKLSNYNGSYRDAYSQGLSEGAASGISAGLRDAKAAKSAMDKYDDSNVEITEQAKPEKPTTTEPPTQTPVTKPTEPVTPPATPDVVEPVTPPTTPNDVEPETPTTNITENEDYIIVEEIEEERVYGEEEPLIIEESSLVRVRQ